MDDSPRIEELAPDTAALAEPRTSRGHAAAARMGGIPTGIVGSAVLVAALVALAVAKPWSPPATGEESTAGRGEATSPTAGAEQAIGGGLLSAPGASPGGARTSGITSVEGGSGIVGDVPVASPLPPGAVACGTPVGWRLVTVGRLAGRPVEGQSVVDPLAGAAGPTDPRIPLLPAGEAPLAAAGACRPEATASVTDDRTDRPPALVVGAWRLVDRLADPLPLIKRGPAAATSAAAQLYAPADTFGAGWGPGRYVLEVRVGDLTATAWLGFEVTALPPGAP